MLQVSSLQQQLDAAQSAAAASQRDLEAARKQAAEAQETADAAQKQLQSLQAELKDVSAGNAESAQSLQKLRDQVRHSQRFIILWSTLSHESQQRHHLCAVTSMP